MFDLSRAVAVTIAKLIATPNPVLDLLLGPLLLGHVAEDRDDTDDPPLGIAQRQARHQIPFPARPRPSALLELVVLDLSRREHGFILLVQLHRRALFWQLEGRLPHRVGRRAETEPRRHRVVGANEPPARILEIDRVGNGCEQAVQEVALVK